MGNCFRKPEEPYRRIYYGIIIKTSDAYKNAGTRSVVHIDLINAAGESTGPIKLDNFWHTDFGKGQVNHFRPYVKDIGMPLIVKITLENRHHEDEWLCDWIKVEAGGDEKEFPIYAWIEEELEVTIGTAMLPQKVTNRYVQDLRKREIEQNKVTFSWIPRPPEDSVGWGLPRFVDANSYAELPNMFKRDVVRAKDFLEDGLGAGFQAVLDLLSGTIDPLENLDSYHRLYAHRKLRRIIENPDYLKDWDTDEGMGRQVMTGISPLAFKRCREIPENFNVKNEDVEEFLEGKTLDCQIKAGKIYISDYSKIFKGIGRNAAPGTNLPLICPEAFGLFFVNTEGNFMPVAIQLIPGNRDYLFTPADKKEDWLLAKMYFRCAEGNVHEWIYHFLYTHSIMEPFAVSLFRCLPLNHPLYKLLRPHLRTVSAINADARTSLIPPSALPNKALATSALDLSRAVYKTFEFDDLVIPKVLAKNETDNKDLLPHYYYRDDALELWGIMIKYVKEVISYYYKSEQDIKDDYELQSWVKDVATEGVGWIDGNTKGVPKEIETFDKLIEFCVTIIFTSSVQHAAVNFGQYETYKFAPNAPLAMRLSPHRKGEATEELIMDSLPNLEMATIMVAVSFALSSYSTNDVFLGQYNKRLFTEEPIIHIQNSYTEALKEFEAKVDQRIDNQTHPYTFLLPSRVPNYIAI